METTYESMKTIYAIVTKETESEVPALFESKEDAFHYALDLNLGGSPNKIDKTAGEYYVVEVRVMPNDYLVDPQRNECCGGKCTTCERED